MAADPVMTPADPLIIRLYGVGVGEGVGAVVGVGVVAGAVVGVTLGIGVGVGVGIGVGAGFAAALGTLVTYSQEARHSDVLGPGALLWGFTCLAAIFCGLPATAISALTGWLMRRGE